ncbi:hypothetical protein CC78DRAFT_531993 [Lojkania enalia]|uniref:Uncharacterized protein n=1 Tax=Lojkania enalia TaxID=147567 RepID=A0A9P4KC10_9PLEO|nr:hypothetical protein CC78DRAFT_531993 [Didymosphaeria enalia]
MAACWVMVAQYRLRRDKVQQFLNNKFSNIPGWNFYLDLQGDQWRFWSPRPWTQAEKDQLLDERDEDE